jgi:hypothetical protein
MKRLNAWERKILRCMYGPVVEQGKWRIDTNNELWELYKDLDTVADVKKKRMEWTGYLARIGCGEVVTEVLKNEVEGRIRW